MSKERMYYYDKNGMKCSEMPWYYQECIMCGMRKPIPPQNICWKCYSLGASS